VPDILWANAFFDDPRSLAVAIRLEAERLGRDLTDDDIETYVRIGLDRRELAQRCKDALAAGDMPEYLKLSRQYFGVEPAQ
jgi:hypothetical protein